MTLKTDLMDAENPALPSKEKKYRINEKSDLFYTYRARDNYSI